MDKRESVRSEFNEMMKTKDNLKIQSIVAALKLSRLLSKLEKEYGYVPTTAGFLSLVDTALLMLNDKKEDGRFERMLKALDYSLNKVGYRIVKLE